MLKVFSWTPWVAGATPHHAPWVKAWIHSNNYLLNGSLETSKNASKTRILMQVPKTMRMRLSRCPVPGVHLHHVRPFLELRLECTPNTCCQTGIIGQNCWHVIGLRNLMHVHVTLSRCPTPWCSIYKSHMTKFIQYIWQPQNSQIGKPRSNPCKSRNTPEVLLPW
jgi:hypothetical protein